MTKGKKGKQGKKKKMAVGASKQVNGKNGEHKIKKQQGLGARAITKRANKSKKDKAASKTGVRFGSVMVREFATSLWGGGGVPADDGPPLGLSWKVEGESETPLNQFEQERTPERIEKDSYAWQGNVAAGKRVQMLLKAGNTLKQIQTARAAVAEIQRMRCQANAVLFDDQWLFRVPAARVTGDEVQALIGCADVDTIEVESGDWQTGPSFAASVAALFKLSAAEKAGMLSKTSMDGVDWAGVQKALRVLFDQRLLLLMHNQAADTGTAKKAKKERKKPQDNLYITKFVDSIARAWCCPEQEAEPRTGSCIVVLDGYAAKTLVARWPNGECNEYEVRQLDL